MLNKQKPFIAFILTLSYFLTSLSCLAAKDVRLSKLAEDYVVMHHKTPKKIIGENFFDQNDKVHTLEEFENTPILLCLWATWCTFCTSKMKSLDQLQKNLKNESFKIIAISEDYKGAPIVEQFYKTKEITNLEIFVDKKNKLFNALDVSALPTAILINKQGFEVARIVGVADWSNDVKLRELIDQYIPKDQDLQNSPPKEKLNK